MDQNRDLDVATNADYQITTKNQFPFVQEFSSVQKWLEEKIEKETQKIGKETHAAVKNLKKNMDLTHSVVQSWFEEKAKKMEMKKQVKVTKSLKKEYRLFRRIPILSVEGKVTCDTVVEEPPAADVAKFPGKKWIDGVVGPAVLPAVKVVELIAKLFFNK